MPKCYCRSLENARVGIAAEQVDDGTQAFLREGALRQAQLSKDVCRTSTNARIIRGRELKGFVEHFATAEPVQGHNGCPIAATVFAVVLAIVFATLLASPVCSRRKKFGDRS
jgi:hypothetical protein